MPLPRRCAQAFALSCVAAVLGCAPPRPYADLWVEARPYHAERHAARPPEAVYQQPGRDTDSGAIDNPTGSITLGQAVALALAHSPSLRAAGWEVAAAEMDAAQMGRPPNPRAALAVENFAGPEAGETLERQTLRLSQVIELAGKRAKRRALGQATQRLRAWDYEQRRIDLAAEAASRYVAVVVAQQRLALAEEQRALADAGYRIADDRVRNGQSPGLERDRAEARVALGRIAVEQARQSLAADRADLAATWGAEAPAFDAAAGDLERHTEPPALQTLRARLEQSPRIARWDDEIARQQRAFELAQADAVADPTIGAGARYFPDADDVAGVVELSVPLNVLDDNRHATQAARLRVTKAHLQRQQARTEAGQALSRAHARLEASAFALEALDTQALPAAQAAYRASLDAYEAGVVDYLTTLDAERTLLDTRHRRLDALRDYHLAVIEVERITARAIEEE